MAHFAQLDSENKVIQVLTVANEDVGGFAFPDSEILGATFLAGLFPDTRWKQTSYNSNFRKNYAGIGYTFDAQRDAFIPPQPKGEYVLDEGTCQWVDPTGDV